MKVAPSILARLIVALAIVLVSAAGTTPASSRPAAGARKATVQRAALLVDLNHATVEELKSLPGIADAYAFAIVKNRPYANKTQLSSKGVIPAAAYKKIRGLVIAKQ